MVATSNDKDGGKRTIKVSYDALWNMKNSQSGDIYNEYVYDENGRLTGVFYEGNLKQTISYDANNNIIGYQIYRGEELLKEVGFQYDKRNRPVTIIDDGIRHQYEYDEIGNLAWQENGATREEIYYQYYPNGSLKNMSHMQGQNAIRYADFFYDKRGTRIGSEINGEKTTYLYNGLSRLKSVLEPDGSITDYTFDSRNNITQTMQIADGISQKTDYYYDANNRLLLQEQEMQGMVGNISFSSDDEGIQPRKNTVWDSSNGILQKNTETFTYNGFNQLSKYENEQGFTEYRYDYNGLRCSKEKMLLDQESNLYYLRGRYYDSSSQRMITEDPVKNGLNWYIYGGNNPISFFDPSGFEPVSLREEVEKAGGSVYYNQSTGESTYVINGQRYYKFKMVK